MRDEQRRPKPQLRMATKDVMTPQNGTILLIENNPDDAHLAQIAFERAGIGHLLTVVADGAEALAYLKGARDTGDPVKSRLPKLILLDLAMPGVSGLQMLEQLAREPELKEIPVTILSGSNYSPDVEKAYELGAKSFLEKPCDLAKFSALIKDLVDRWVGAAPSRPSELRSF